MTFEEKAEIIINQLRADRDRLLDAIEKIRAEIQSNFEDSTKPNYIDAMMRNIGREECLEIINKYAEQETDIAYIGEFCHKHGLVLMSKEMADKYAEQEPLTEEDYKELHDRFGDYVEFVVRDMVSGTGERWRKAVRNDKRRTRTSDRLSENKFCGRK